MFVRWVTELYFKSSTTDVYFGIPKPAFVGHVGLSFVSLINFFILLSFFFLLSS